ncbi:MAG: ABC transporter substrate-binding protein [Anaerolineae bacterium]
MKIKKALWLLVLLTVALLPGAVSAAEPKMGGTAVVAIAADPRAIDPAFAYDFDTNPVVTQIGEGLLKIDAEGKIQPLLAESWENPDPLTYIYHIRKGVKFHNGEEMTAEDVVFSLERIRDPKLASYLAWMFENVDTIEKTGDWEVTVKLKKFDASWRYVPATSAGHVISKKWAEEVGDKLGAADTGLVGTGPFKFVSWDSGNEVVIERFDEYWDKASGGPYLDRVVYKILPEANTRVAGLGTGEIDIAIGNIPLDLLPVVEDMSNLVVKSTPSYFNESFFFNCQRGPFKDPKVRQAINYALDKDTLFKELVGSGGDKPKSMPVGPAMWTYAKELWEKAYEDLPDYAYNLEKAKQLMAESSVPEGFEATITTNPDPLYLNTALAIQDAVKPLGIELSIEKVTLEERYEIQWNAERNYDIIPVIWGADFPDPLGNLVPIFHSANVGDGGNNFSNYINPKVDELFDKAMAEPDDTERAKLLIEAQKIIAEDCPLIVIEFVRVIMPMNKRLTGYDPVPLWFWDPFMKDIYLTGE